MNTISVQVHPTHNTSRDDNRKRDEGVAGTGGHTLYSTANTEMSIGRETLFGFGIAMRKNGV